MTFSSSPSARQPDAKRKSISMKSRSKTEIATAQSKTDWARLTAKGKQGKASKEHPDADVKHIVRSMVRRGLKPLVPKSSISLRVDSDVLEWFKAQGTGYQTRINSVLRAFRDASVS